MRRHRTTGQWLNPAAFAVPTANRGTFGTAGVGSVVGPGTGNVSLSLAKEILLGGQRKFEFGIAAANLFNHRNYEPPNMQVDAPGFGQHHRAANRRRRRAAQPGTQRAVFVLRFVYLG